MNQHNQELRPYIYQTLFRAEHGNETTCLSVSRSVCVSVCPLSHISPLGHLLSWKRCHLLISGQRRSKYLWRFLWTCSVTKIERYLPWWPYIGSAIFPTENTHAHYGYASSRQDRTRCEAPYAIAVSSPCILALQRSLQGWRGLARVVSSWLSASTRYLLDRRVPL